MARLKLMRVRDGKLVIIRDQILDIKEFRDVWSRVRKTKGDYDGRLKKVNTLEFKYIIYMSDEDTEANIYALDDNHITRSQTIIRDLDFPKGWKPDDKVKKAIKKMREIEKDWLPELAVLRSIRVSLRLSNKLVQIFQDSLRDLMEAVEDEAVGSADERLKTVKKYSDALEDYTGKVLKMSSSIPKSLKQIEEAIDMINEAKSRKVVKRDGEEIGLFETPESVNNIN